MAEKVTFDHYEVLTRDDGSIYELGRGAMGITYRAFDTNLECDVALKVISGSFLNTDGARERFVSEARAAAKLRHPNVASVFHLGVEGDSYFYAMEFIDGQTVEELVRSRGPLDPLLALRITAQVARALNAAQKHLLVHRDIKPSNLMLVQDEDEMTVKVIDFGLAKVSDPEAAGDRAATTIAGFVGTPYYASPEQLQEKTLDSRSDIYSLGMTLWFMLSGTAPFTGTMAEVMSQHLSVEPPMERLAAFPAPVAQLVRRMVEKDPANRPQSPLELRRELDNVIEVLEAQSGALRVGDLGNPDLMETIADLDVAAAGAPNARLAARYEVLEDLGEGEMGKLHRARDRESNEVVRLVTLNPALIEDPEAYTRLEREVEKVRVVSHPNLLRVILLEWIEPLAVLALEWTEGFSLLDTLRTRRELEPDGVLLLLEQLAGAVDCAIGAGLDRLDFALHQMMVAFPEPITPEREAELLRAPVRDWPAFTLKVNPLGITRELRMSDTWAGGQTIVGEIATASAPVATQDEDQVRPRYVQALAALVYELLGGTLPAEILRPGPARPLERYVPISTLPEEGNNVLRQGLDPEVSYPSGRAFLEALRAVDTLHTRRPSFARRPAAKSPVASVSTVPPMARVQTPVPTPPPLSTPAAEKPRSRTGLIVAAILVGLLLLGAVLLKPMLRTIDRIVDRGGVSTPAPTATPGADPTLTPSATPLATATPVPTATLVPTPTPIPTPSRQDALKVAVAQAESFESERNWVSAIAAFVAIADEYPESDLGRVRLEILLQRLRSEPDAIDGEKFANLREPLEGAAKLGVTSAMFLLGENLRETDPKASFDWLCAAAAQGSEQAFTQVGLMYSNGAGVPRDLKKAVWWFEEAGNRGDPAGLTLLAECYIDGKGVSRDPGKAVAILQRAVAMKEPRAMNLLGTLYQKGVGVDEDFDEARKLFTESHERGYLNALGNLGVLYINGQGVPRSPKKALELFEKGARAGSDNCMYFYARCLETGTGIARNSSEAEEWYRRAAALGHARARKWRRENNVDY